MTIDRDDLATGPERAVGSPRLFLSDLEPNGARLDDQARLRRHLERLEKINASLIRRVERSMDHHGNAYTLFQAAIVLDEQVRARTEELSAALGALETTNRDLVKANEVAVRSNASKTRFLAAASHDLLQPLNAARLALAALSEERVTVPARRLVDQVDRSLTNVEELLRSLFVISKLDAGAQVPERGPVSITRLFGALQGDFLGEASRKALRFRVRPIAVSVDSDPIFLRRILQNLISNAVRYTERGGILVGCRRRGDMLRIEVRDTGVGIAPGQHGKIFDEFFRAAPKHDMRTEGLGLGLAIVRRMADALGHAIDLRSEIGRGSMFAVTVPLSGVPAAGHGDAAGITWTARGFDGAVIGLVENDRDAMQALEALLARWSCSPVSGASGADMLGKLPPAGRVDLLLVDFHLDDGATGLDVVARTRTAFGPEIPAIIITADHSKEVADKVSAAGCELLTKPVRPAELRALMAHLLAERG